MLPLTEGQKEQPPGYVGSSQVRLCQAMPISSLFPGGGSSTWSGCTMQPIPSMLHPTGGHTATRVALGIHPPVMPHMVAGAAV